MILDERGCRLEQSAEAQQNGIDHLQGDHIPYPCLAALKEGMGACNDTLGVWGASVRKYMLSMRGVSNELFWGGFE